MNCNTGKLVLVAILVVLSLTLSMSAASAQTVIIADGSADSGATTTVTVTADAVTDLANFDITVTYDSAVVNVTAAENNAAFGSSMNNLEGASTGTVRLMSFNTGSGQTGDGVLLSTLTLEALGTAAQTSALTLTINSLMDPSEGDITATVDDGLFTVSGVPSGPVVTISDGSADTGATTTVTVTADAVTDLANFDITVTYDSAVVNVTAAENNAAFGSSMNNLEGASTGTVRLMSFNTGTTGQTGDGVLLSTLTLEALGTAAQTSALTLTINSLMDPSEGDITATAINGVFTVGAAAPILTWTTEPPASVTQGDDVTFKVGFSESAAYYFRVENSTNGVVWRYPETGTGSAMNPTERTWTTTTDTPTGNYTIIININGADNSNTRTVTVSSAANQPPTAVIASPTASGTYHEGTEVSFLSTGSTDPDGTIEAYTWDFGDGSTGMGVSTTHTYTTTGSMTVTLTVTDDGGANDTETVTINVYPTGAVIVHLYTGWNLIAIPVNDPTADTAAELASKITGCKEVVKWDASTQTYDPYTRIAGDWTGTDFAITGGTGLFVNMEGATTVGFTGGAWS